MTSNPYDYSVLFDRSKTTTTEEHPAWELADRLLDDLLPDVRRSRARYRQNMITTLLNLWTAHKAHPRMYVSYSRDKDQYKMTGGAGRYNKLGITYTCLTQCVDGLASVGLIQQAAGIHFATYHRRARMRADPHLLEMFNEHRFNLDMVLQERDPIILKNGQKQKVPYNDTRKTRAMRQRVNRIHDMIGRTRIEIPCSRPGQCLPCDRTRKRLYRVFNHGRFDRGGRFFGHWVQELPKKDRAKLLIDGDPVCEWDFSGMSVNLLYRREGAQAQADDPYAVDGIALSRETVKTMVQIMLNSSTRKEAVKACARLPECQTMDLDQKGINAFVLPEIQEHYSTISHHFYTGAGLSLQFEDSQIAEAVLLRLLDQSIPCIPVHDSFIVQQEHEDALCDAMRQASSSLAGGGGGGRPLPMKKSY